MNPIEIIRRFRYHKPTEKQVPMYERNRNKARELAELINGQCPDNREKSIAISKVEEAVMWANASIARGKEVEKADPCY